ncbi:alginate lyase family protein [Rouxiella sp. WC2420]|uniref:Alginate lyase family protein n=1 Tax=Rouxiella sp. WC2420 TaxID=3234145 RepID=A0AB39VIX0_9GAMM
MKGRLVKSRISILMLACVTCCSAYAVAPNHPALAFMQASELAKVKQQLAEDKAAQPTRQAYEYLLTAANRDLKSPLLSVTEKGMTPPSGSKHDYLSLSAYWWPDPNKADGLPWIRHDGQIDPASKNDQSDGVRLATFTARVQDLTLAWYFSGQQRYADKAAAMLRTWFIDPQTRMNPNLNFAQGIPGKMAGRNAGVLDGRYFSIRIVDSLLLLRGNPAWTAADEQKMHQWMTEYLNWLQNSPIAIKESKTKNNHGNWYATQVAGIAWYLDKPELVKKMVALTESKLETQLMPDGTQPLELARTRSFHYSYFNLQAVSLLAVLAHKTDGTDLWAYQTARGASVLKALDFMAQYTDGTKPWPYKSLDRSGIRIIPLLSWADSGTGKPKYETFIRSASFALPEASKAAAVNHMKPTHGAIVEAQRDTWLTSLPAWVN